MTLKKGGSPAELINATSFHSNESFTNPKAIGQLAVDRDITIIEVQHAVTEKRDVLPSGTKIREHLRLVKSAKVEIQVKRRTRKIT